MPPKKRGAPEASVFEKMRKASAERRARLRAVLNGEHEVIVNNVQGLSNVEEQEMQSQPISGPANPNEAQEGGDTKKKSKVPSLGPRKILPSYTSEYEKRRFESAQRRVRLAAILDAKNLGNVALMGLPDIQHQAMLQVSSEDLHDLPDVEQHELQDLPSVSVVELPDEQPVASVSVPALSDEQLKVRVIQSRSRAKKRGLSQASEFVKRRKESALRRERLAVALLDEPGPSVYVDEQQEGTDVPTSSRVAQLGTNKKGISQTSTKYSRKRRSRTVVSESEHEDNLSQSREAWVELPDIDQQDILPQRMGTFAAVTAEQQVAVAREMVAEIRAEQPPGVCNIRNARGRTPISLECEAFRYDPNADYRVCASIGKMDKVCKYCRALKFKNEPPAMCCRGGKVRLDPLAPPPPELSALMRGDTAESRDFLKNILKYNACFQMTSFGATSIEEFQGYQTTFKVQGQVYHLAGSLLPAAGEPPQFLQIYFMGDTEQAAARRCDVAHLGEANMEVVLTLQEMLHNCNPLIRSFTTTLERMPADDFKVVIKADRMPAGEHRGRYNVPEVDEVAIVMAGNESTDYRDIVLHKRGTGLKRIMETNRYYDALQYPLLFPYGEEGYDFTLRQVDTRTGASGDKKVSSKDFYAYRLMIRNGERNHLLDGRQLLSQYTVDMYAKVEGERLRYIRYNQNGLKAEQYVHLRDAIANDGNAEGVGQKVILPSSYVGSPRHMQEYAQDCIAMVREYGRPDLFITFTCNSKCSEIQELLIEGQTPCHRHDLTARVYELKLKKLKEVIRKSKIFGIVKGWVNTIEFQKRGLPHAHILVWLPDKIHPTEIDDIISAEIPNPDLDPELFRIVTKHMIHGPCGHLNPQSPCMKDGKCSKNYPRQLLQETQTGNDGYPLYRRRGPNDGGFTATVRVGRNDVIIDNSWVVPYSPILCKMFDAHINVEYCNSVKSIKYICKYVHKGSDMAVFGLQNQNSNDEVSTYELARYICAGDACRRLFSFEVHDRYPNVVHLTVHLENGQRVYFTETNAARVANNPPDTTLTAFFKLCQQDEFARTLLYVEVPKYYTWSPSTKVFARRKVGRPNSTDPTVVESDTIGRVYTVHPNNAECFYLRMLLHTVRGPRSFVDLRTVDNEVCQTYREACLKLGLLEDDQHWVNALQEAELASGADQIRRLFAIILTQCNPSNPLSLWERFKEALSEDILNRVRRENPNEVIEFSPEIFNQALIILEDKCKTMSSKLLEQVGLPAPIRNQEERLNMDYLREINYNVEELRGFVAAHVPLLNQDQRRAYLRIMDQVESRNGAIMFLEAPGGTGKTFLINLILAEVRSRGEIAIAVASSGIAATLMEGGRTAHSAFQLPLDLPRQENPTCNISRNSGKGQVLKECKLIVWDECTMAHKKMIEALDRTLRDLRKNDNLMGGVLLLLCGDFRQTLPVIPKSTMADEINACLKQSILWRHVQRVGLTQNMRAQLENDDDLHVFSNTLLEIGDGRLQESAQGLVTLMPNLCNMVLSVEDLIGSIYPDLRVNLQNLRWLKERTILAPKNDGVDELNRKILSILPGEVSMYKSIDTAQDPNHMLNYPIEFLNSLNPPGMPSHCLELKVGVPIILLRNLDPPKLCNGTRLCIKRVFGNLIEACILTGKGEGEVVFIPRIPLISSDFPVEFKRLQFPVRVAFAMTINKSQGQSIKYCGVDLRSQCFSHGQFYVACSRVGSPKNLFILAPNGKTNNVVYRQVLSVNN